ncbi:MAG TPA: UDP-N-acetylglucosamine--N-acetylmuramyl-(pentapeptide) pyrophosphoryl-undecaprenol N-acetylglucosamine transferase [Synergistales bacterium]|jgi:UDP-N-acetylglucosamine--N-acetylmuramyl-(pentapeptide) pyrophosphoryl-undecaprenol N-acetylglucosamine transferase|nr:UDP-N-acetylglucosamine--N-acetylmuramyl-(pentapeptide) pyrophosphoryl-undecaprenol N-acetylglucosamine transferase [Synergistales bacterium]HRV70541.1 UDP-N-acetylglucosamine--N-acetylmuramyl-(pentapeptide) pyrophosphoryl-undecaprenol N-acetylglucosamine transferase [Thermovirgaceae bacterium]
MKVLLVAGGTGGHIWPAIAFALWLNEKNSGNDTRFACGSRSLEREIFAHEGIEPLFLPIEGSPLWGDLRTRFSRWRGMWKSFWISAGLLREWEPDVCILFGGYVSFPVIIASLVTGTPFVVHEQNARAGRVTRTASLAGSPVFSGWKECLPLGEGKFVRSGIPVRSMTRMAPEIAWRKLGHYEEVPPSPRVLVLGGSLGSDPVSQIFAEASTMEPFSGWSIIQVSAVKEPVKRGVNHWILPREWDVGLLYSLADVVVSRAGASTLAEIVEFGLPSVIIPWRGAADDHQFENARLFKEQGHGSIWEINNGLLPNLGFMIDYELKRARPGQETCPESGNFESCEILWRYVQQYAEGRGRN